MPADAWAVNLAVGRFGRAAEKPKSKLHNSGTQESPLRGQMAGQNQRIDDTLLVRAAQRGDRAAFEELVRHYDQAVLRLAMHLTGSATEAQDVYQEAFLKAYKNIGKFRFECSFYTWIYRIVSNLCMDHLRKRQVRKEDAPVATDAQGESYDVLAQVADERAASNPEHDLISRELGSRIGAALQELSPRERMVFELKHYHGLKLRTVGEILQTTEDTAKNTLFRATQKLRGALADMR
ncbi:MAG TPA: sigma-70 family RNA polymerase sigma factor [Terriglobales bacterium]|jgi:RNA polymerase sigma-70 factor (ECF subfamily)|nr:sigma-70 family RNA polymerase sigma factor [Terriglobales bacterium]